MKLEDITISISFKVNLPMIPAAWQIQLQERRNLPDNLLEEA